MAKQVATVLLAVIALAASQAGHLGGGNTASYSTSQAYFPAASSYNPQQQSSAPIRQPAYNVQSSYAPATRVNEYDPNPQYSYAYNVNDPSTGDLKSQHEERNGDSVRGSYSLVEPDGSRRVVDYIADSENGFNAVVRREPTNHPSSAPATTTAVATPVAYTTPTYVSARSNYTPQSRGYGYSSSGSNSYGTSGSNYAFSPGYVPYNSSGSNSYGLSGSNSYSSYGSNYGSSRGYPGLLYGPNAYRSSGSNY